VICDSQDAVFMNPGSTVTSPVSRSSEETTTPSLPSVARTTGRSCGLPLTTSWTGSVATSDMALLLGRCAGADLGPVREVVGL
jgi:hypothetical protein